MSYSSWLRDRQFQEEVDKMQRAGFVTKVVYAQLREGEPPQHLLYAYPFAPPNLVDDE